MDKDNDDKKRVLVQWLNDTFIHEDDEEAKQIAIKLVNKKSNTWPVLLGFKEERWDSWFPFGMGVQIFNHLHPGITIIQNYNLLIIIELSLNIREQQLPEKKKQKTLQMKQRQGII